MPLDPAVETPQQLAADVIAGFPGANTSADLVYAFNLLTYIKDAMWAAGYRSQSDFAAFTTFVQQARLQNAVDQAKATLARITTDRDAAIAADQAAAQAKIDKAQADLNAAEAALAASIQV